MFEFKLPDVGEGMHEAEIVRWLVNPGDTLKVDQLMLEIQTDKALVEIPAPVAGTVKELKVGEGQLAHVGDVLITFETQPSRPIAEAPAAIITPDEVAQVAANNQRFVQAETQQATPNGRVRAAPAVRKRALELDVDLAKVPPSSADGRVLLQDVVNYASSHQQSAISSQVNSSKTLTTEPNSNQQSAVSSQVNSSKPLTNEPNTNGNFAKPNDLVNIGVNNNNAGLADEERVPLVGLRRRIAERMEQAWRTIPHVTTFDDADGERLMALRKNLLPTAEKQGVRLTYLPIIVKMVVQALKQHKIINSSLDEQTREIIYKHAYHIGLATATSDGLLVPVVRHADRMNLLELASEINRLTEGARNRTLKPPELSGSTFTITNTGSFGGKRGTPIINPPEAAILGVGQLSEQAVVRNGQVVVRNILPLTLSFDHRLIDGADAGNFMHTLLEIVENPDLLLL